MSKTVVGSLKSMEGALKQGIVANLLYGDSIGLAFKKALAAQLAEVSAEATIQGLKHAAYALGSLAFGDFAGAAKHGAASAAFFGLAALTGKAASSLAKSAGMRGDAGTGAAAGSAVASTGTAAQDRGTNVVEQSRNTSTERVHNLRPENTVTHTRIIDRVQVLEPPPGWVAKTIKEKAEVREAVLGVHTEDARLYGPHFLEMRERYQS
jgi:hypothetical protein